MGLIAFQNFDFLLKLDTPYSKSFSSVRGRHSLYIFDVPLNLPLRLAKGLLDALEFLQDFSNSSGKLRLSRAHVFRDYLIDLLLASTFISFFSGLSELVKFGLLLSVVLASSLKVGLYDIAA